MGRPETAFPTIISLQNQTFLPENWEIIIVSVRAQEISEKINNNLPVKFVPLNQKLIPSQTRIEGIKKATGDWFLFIDDDIELKSDFLKKLMSLIQSAKNLGAIGPMLPGKNGSFFERLTDYTNFWSQQNLKRNRRDWLYSASLAVSAEAYVKAGGFNPELEIGEDVDLTQKINKNNFLVIYEPELVAFHNHKRDTLLAMVKYFWKNGGHAKFFLLQNPQLRVFSLLRAFRNSFDNLNQNITLNKNCLKDFGKYKLGVCVNYIIYQISMEWHYQYYLYKNNFYMNLKPETPEENYLVISFKLFSKGKWFRGIYYYLRAMLRK